MVWGLRTLGLRFRLWVSGVSSSPRHLGFGRRASASGCVTCFKLSGLGSEG